MTAGPLLRLVFSRLAPVPGAVAQNRRLVIRAVTKAARSGAGWITTPELAVSAYTFDDTLGTDWIEPQPDHSMSRICRLAARLRVTLFLSPPGKTPRSRRRVGTLHKRQGAPLFVCHRTGQDRTLDSRQAEHVLVQGGTRLLSLSCEQSARFRFDWSLTTGRLAGPGYQRILIQQHSSCRVVPLTRTPTTVRAGRSRQAICQDRSRH